MRQDRTTSVYHIYELRDPRIKEESYAQSTRYIGITLESLEQRLYMHIHKTKMAPRGKRLHSQNWIMSLLLNNTKPTIHLIEDVVGLENAYLAEIYWIKEFKEYGCKLTNLTLGGGGEKTPKQRKVMTSKIKRNPNDPRQKPIYQFTKSGKFIRKFKSMVDAGKRLNLCAGTISSAASGRYSHAGGFTWSYSRWEKPKPAKERESPHGILQYSKSNEFIRYWKNAAEAEKALGLVHHTINGFLCGENTLRATKGFIFKKANAYEAIVYDY